MIKKFLAYTFLVTTLVPITNSMCSDRDTDMEELDSAAYQAARSLCIAHEKVPSPKSAAMRKYRKKSSHRKPLSTEKKNARARRKKYRK